MSPRKPLRVDAMASKPKLKPVESSTDAIAAYNAALLPNYAAVCNQLRTEIDKALPKATSKLWHGHPVWFINDTPVAGYNITAKKGVNLLFWSGQLFEDPVLVAAGKFKAAQIQYSNVSEIDAKILRRWLKKSSSIIWDYKNLCRVSTEAHRA
jgi:hypothetical protein